MKSIPERIFWIASLVMILTAIAVFLGWFNPLASDGKISSEFGFSILAYWAIGCLIFLIYKFRSKSREILILTIMVGLLSLLSEYVLRKIYPLKTGQRFHGIPSPIYHHGYLEKTTMYAGSFEGRDVFVTTNEDGLRTSYSPQSFSHKNRRIILLGDSFTFGLGVKQNKTFPNLLENKIHKNDSTLSVGVLNAGIISHSPLLSQKLFESFSGKYNPQIVIHFVDVTDIGDDFQYALEMDPQGGFDKATAFTKRPESPALFVEFLAPIHKPFFGALKYPWTLLSSKVSSDYYNFRLVINNVVENNRYFIYRHSLNHTRPYFENTLNNIKNIATKANQMGAQYVLVIYPRFHHWNTKECPKNWEKNEYGLNEKFQYEFFNFFDSKKDSMDLLYYNMLNDFKNTSEFPLVFNKDPHWNEKGHEFVADQLLKYLSKNGLIN